MWGENMGETIHAKVTVHALSAHALHIKTGITEVKPGGYFNGQGSAHVIKKFAKKADFPSLGDKECLYVDMEDNITYVWDEGNLTYTPIASDWHDIRIINGGEA